MNPIPSVLDEADIFVDGWQGAMLAREPGAVQVPARVCPTAGLAHGWLPLGP